MEVIVLGLWALGLVALAWVVVLSRMLVRGRESDQRAREGRWWVHDWEQWSDTLPMR